MNNYQWHNDDFQNNTTHTDNTYFYEPPKKEKIKFSQRIKNSKIMTGSIKMPTVILAVLLSVTIGVSGYALISPMVGNNQSTTLDEIQKDVAVRDNNTDSSHNAQTIISSGERVPLTIPQIAKKVGPTVVGVVNKVTYNNMQNFGFFGGYIPNGQNETVESGSGSGVIISEDGYIVTNNHVIEGASEIYVVTNTGDEYKATLKGTDSKTDLAVLKIEGTFPYATLGNSSELEVGELAVAIGNPLGQEFAGTVTDGIISALNRSITVDNKQLTLLQTNAAINPGNSGGPLVNQYGEVIGINTAKISSSKLEGLGFAIPIDEAKPIIDDLLQSGYVRGRPVIGIGGRNVTQQLAQAYNWKVGIYVASMSPDSPAYLAGIQIGDIIVQVDGKDVATVDELNEIKNKHRVGDKLELKVYRNGQYVNISLILGEEMPG